MNKTGIEYLTHVWNFYTGCVIRYCADIYDKPVFECLHKIPFPLFALQGAKATGNWGDVIKRHAEEAIQ